jgi:hypothetical protein
VFGSQNWGKKKSLLNLGIISFLFGLVFFCFAVLGLELRAYTLSHSTNTFFMKDFFQDRVSQTICPGLLRMTILLIFAS